MPAYTCALPSAAPPHTSAELILQTCAVIYVSTDTDPRAAERVLSGHAYMRMVFEDNSDFASAGPEPAVVAGSKGKGKGAVEVEEVKRGEDFVTAGVSGRCGTDELVPAYSGIGK
jgi:hypothetical protein